MTSSGDLCHIRTSRLIYEANQWTGSCVMQFLPEGHSELNVILNLCGSAKYITVLCFSIRGGDAGVSAPYRTWGVEGFLEGSLMCWVITGWECVFTMVQMRLKDIKKKPYHCNNLTLELVGWRLSTSNVKFPKSYFSLSEIHNISGHKRVN